MDNLRAFAEAVGKDIKALSEASSGGLVNTGWITLSEHAKVKRFGDVVTLDLNLPTGTNIVLGTIPSDVFSVGDRPLSFSVYNNPRMVRNLRIDPNGEIRILTLGAAVVRTQVTLMV